MLFDTHAHYDSGAFNADRMEVLASMPEQGVELILNPGCDLESSRTAVSLANAFPFVYAAVGVHPVIPDFLRIFQNARMLQDAGWLCAVLEEGAAVFLHGQRRSQTVLHHGDRRKADQTVEAQAGHMKHLFPAEDDVLVFFTPRLIRIGMVDVVDLAVFVAVYLDVLRE